MRSKMVFTCSQAFGELKNARNHRFRSDSRSQTTSTRPKAIENRWKIDGNPMKIDEKPLVPPPRRASSASGPALWSPPLRSRERPGRAPQPPFPSYSRHPDGAVNEISRLHVPQTAAKPLRNAPKRPISPRCRTRERPERDRRS